MSISRDVRLLYFEIVCICVCILKMLLVFGSFPNSLLCIVGELEGGGGVPVAVC